MFSSIPSRWKKKLKNSYEENETNDCKNKIIDTQNVSSKTLRQIRTEMIFEKPTLVGKLGKASFSADEISHIQVINFLSN